MVDEYKDRLKEAMADAKVGRQQLADAIGISYQAVRKVVLGESAGFDLANHNAACAFLGVHSAWLLDGTPPKSLDVRPMARPVSHFTTSLPVQLEWESVVNTKNFEELPEDFLVEVPDDALGARLPRGSKVWFKRVSNEEIVQPKSVCIVEANGKRYIRQIALGADGALSARAIDDAFPTLGNFRVLAVMFMRQSSVI